MPGGDTTWQLGFLLLTSSPEQVRLWGGAVVERGGFRFRGSGWVPPAASRAREDLLALGGVSLLKEGEGVLAGRGDVMDWLPPPPHSGWLQAAAAGGDPTV